MKDREGFFEGKNALSQQKTLIMKGAKERQAMKDAYYFPHDSNAQHDEKILRLRAIHQWQGYGLYWAIIERLRESKEYKFSLDCIPGLAISLSHPQAELEALLKDCFLIGLLTKKGKYFYSVSLLRRMSKIDQRREALKEAGRRGGLKSSHPQACLKPALSDPQAVKESKVKESKVKESKEKKSKEKKKEKNTPTFLSDEDFLKALKENSAYSHININNELAKMDVWLLTQKGRQKTRKFIVNWLNRIDKPLKIGGQDGRNSGSDGEDKYKDIGTEIKDTED